ncbi:receptor expression-enhancing protein 1 isoform X2 [Cimex lectularius]|uniref:Receptor expression-enhancing protein n=1 Tax=Cimex lectularius TaxID=79782 RepID=A0A8I6SJT0_CIMLE|nr:receptor expression-enhancing protein 1 isoform X2 [Cimex lectularius]
MLTALVSRLMILAFGTLYPAYASYKAVRTKDVKEYVKWMMYWIVFALFTCAETFTDVLFSFWFPFYYEIKVAIVFWLLSPATKGSSFLYRNFVHPAFQKRESEIDEMLHKAKERGYNTVLNIGSKGVSYATNVILQTAIKGGGGIMEQLRKSYSLTDLSPQISKDNTDGSEDRMRPPTQRRARQMESMVEMNFPEVETNLRGVNHHNNMIGDIRSTEDISSGFSSTDQLNTEGVLTRSSSVASTRTRPRGRGAAARRAPVSEDAEESDTELWTDCSAGNTGASQVDSSSSTLPRTSKRTTRKRTQ